MPKPADLTAFFGPYRKAFESTGTASPSRQMVHLGLPTEDAVVLWYTLDKGAVQADPLEVILNGETWRDVCHFQNDTYSTGRIEVRGLTADVKYTIKVKGAGLVETTVVSHTKRSRRDNGFSFLFGSCFEPYDYSNARTTWISRSTRASMRNLSERAGLGPEAGGPDFYLGLGDQIYVDPGADKIIPRNIAYLWGGKSQKMRGKLAEAPYYLTGLYLHHFGLPDMDAAFSRIPTAMMWDDHDIRDGWGSQRDETDPAWREYYRHARDAFVAFQGARNPNFAAIHNARGWVPQSPVTPVHDSDMNDTRQIEETDFTFDWGAATYFVADGRSAKTPGPLFMGKQWERVLAWLKDPKHAGRPTVFVFCFPVPVAANIGRVFQAAQKIETSGRDDAEDRIHWKDRMRLMELFVSHFSEHRIHRLLILSGDVHYSGLQSIQKPLDAARPNERTVLGYEIISSGLAQTKFNRAGGYFGTVSGSLRGFESALLNDVWIQDHGMFSGPCFAEIFVEPATSSAEAPNIKLAFFPSTFVFEKHWLLPFLVNREDYALPTSSFKPLLIEAYRENTAGPGNIWGNQNTTNHLPDDLYRYWVTDGKARLIPAQP